MAGSNQFIPFATGAGANTLTPVAYAALASLTANGFSAGTAQSQQVNTVLRQSSFAASAIAQFMADATGAAVNDDGVIANFENSLRNALTVYNIATDTGTANTYVAALTPAPTALTDGMVVWLTVKTANTGASTLNLNGLGAVPIVGGAHAALQGGELVAGGRALLVYAGSLSKWVLLECSGAAVQVGDATKSQQAVTLGQCDGRYLLQPTTSRAFTGGTVRSDMDTLNVNYTLQTLTVTGARSIRVQGSAAFSNTSASGAVGVILSIAVDGSLTPFGGHYLGATLPAMLDSGSNIQIPISLADRIIGGLNPNQTYTITLRASKTGAIGPVRVIDAYLDVEQSL